MLKIAISQPTYLPWLGYFNQIASADIFVFLDSVQVDRRSWQTRNRIKDVNDLEIWLSVPIVASRAESIANAKVIYEQSTWVKKHLRSIEQHLARTPYVQDVLTLLQTCLQQQPASLAELNVSIIKAVSKELKLAARFVMSSELHVQGSKAELLLGIIKHFDATDYLANQGSADYLELSRTMFINNNINIHYQKWSHPIYLQKGKQFTPFLSWVDAVSHLGFEQVARLIQQ